jgi:hypothetical protein
MLIRTVIPGRETAGSMLVPSIAAIVGTIVWASLTWAGLKFDGGWIWVASLLASGVAALVAALIIPRSRKGADDELLKRLSSPSAASK